MARPARKKRTLPVLPSIEAPPVAQREAVLAADKTVLREAIAERANWRDPDDMDVHTRAPKVVTAFRRVDQLARRHRQVVGI